MELIALHRSAFCILFIDNLLQKIYTKILVIVYFIHLYHTNLPSYTEGTGYFILFLHN